MAHAAVHRAGEASLRIAQILDVGTPHTKEVWKPAMALVGAFSVLCLMFLPRVPQFVAFERNPRAIQTEETHSALIRQSPIATAAVIPAAMQTESSGSLKRAPQKNSHGVGHHLEQRSGDPRVILARWRTDTERNPVENLTMGPNTSVPVVSETVFIIQTTERVGPNSWVWSVGVWRLTFVNAAPDGAGRGLVARKT
jgi:hypothetical protein